MAQKRSTVTITSPTDGAVLDVPITVELALSCDETAPGGPLLELEVAVGQTAGEDVTVHHGSPYTSDPGDVAGNETEEGTFEGKGDTPRS